MLPIFDELKYARLMNDGDATDRDNEEKRVYTYTELLIYTKWLRWSLFQSYPSKDAEFCIRNGLVTFCNQLLLNFNKDTDFKLIDNLIEDSKKYKLRGGGCSIITNKEWNQIMSLDDNNARRIYFAMLILAKYNRDNPVILAEQPNNPEQTPNLAEHSTSDSTSVKTSDSTSIIYTDTRFRLKNPIDEINKFAGVKFKSGNLKLDKSRNLKLDPTLKFEPYQKLYNAGLIDLQFYRHKKQTVIILTDADVDPDGSDTYMVITDYSKVDEYFHYGLKEVGYKICQECGAAFKTKSNRNCYCKACQDSKSSAEFKYIHCQECGKRIKISNRDTKTTLCRKCYGEKRRMDRVEVNRRYYAQHR